MAPDSSAAARQRRSQVVRACDECRLHRIKCDTSSPCSNCRNRDRDCSNTTNRPKALTLSQAHQEIARLQKKIKELEVVVQPHSTTSRPPTPSSLSSCSDHILSSGGLQKSRKPRSLNVWQGVQLQPSRSPHDTWYGPSSLYFFIKRTSNALNTFLREAHGVDQLVPSSESSRKTPQDLRHPKKQPVPLINYKSMSQDMENLDLTPIQEEYFISLFWQSYHTGVLPVIDEKEFKEHYQSLWTTDSRVRAASPLVDIILALCMQASMSSKSQNQKEKLSTAQDTTIAGRSHYQRCQALLTLEMESPTMATLQCHLLCAAYVCGGSFHNTVDLSVGLAVRTAYMLGLHTDDPEEMSLAMQEKRHRLWWATFLMDSKICMKLGRPFSIDDVQSKPPLPRDDQEVSLLAGSTFAPPGDNATWLSFNLHQTKLFWIVREAHSSFYAMDFDPSSTQNPLDEPKTLEVGAEIMQSFRERLHLWTKSVPETLKTQRQNKVLPFSIDASTLEMEEFAPLWLQRQRILLEFMFHNLCINLFRPMISLQPFTTSGPATVEIAEACAAHAVILTKLMHQVLSTTSILDGWHELFHWQWNAAMTLQGFTFTYPDSASIPAAREAIGLARDICDIFGKNFPVAAAAVSIVVDLQKRIAQLRPPAIPTTSFGTTGGEKDDASTALDGWLNASGSLEGDPSFMANQPDFDNMDLDDFMNASGNLFDMALDIDCWADLNFV